MRYLEERQLQITISLICQQKLRQLKTSRDRIMNALSAKMFLLWETLLRHYLALISFMRIV